MSEIIKCLNEIIDETSRLYPLHNDLATRAYLDRIIDTARMVKAKEAEREEAQPAFDEKNTFYTFQGLKLHRFAIPGGTVKLIGKRDRGIMPHQIYEIVVNRANGVFPCCAKILCDGEEIFSLESHIKFSQTEQMAVSALHRLLKEKHRCCYKTKKGGEK